MFTGLIQSLGSIQAIAGSRSEQRMRIGPHSPWSDLQLGESIAVNGVCLSVEEFAPGSFWVYASQETLEHSNIGGLKTGDRVNLERALSLQDRLGGHLVSGHVDCLAEIESIAPAGQSRVYKVRFDPQWSAYVVPKGSVALDGISLTVNACGQGFLEVNIIPATQKDTTVDSWRPGSEVNMEVDLIAKYVRQMLDPWQEQNAQPKTEISMDFLRSHGFGG
ncbi:riboflavin synthase [Desulfovermiculus halophilus]|uniref:riboflavin synthase n=1 Tax=Desulfovermiculus halophilus TaxID=339722 RepID=UPI000485360F|nr:riboflavin synthase [Desulfovermiculus halophilus]